MTTIPKDFSVRRNPELDVDKANLAAWNRPENRRWGFRNIHVLSRHAFSIRSANVLQLRTRKVPRIENLGSVRHMTGAQAFVAMVVVQGDEILFEKYASDMARDCPHAMQSITKTHLNLIFGRLVSTGLVDLSLPVSHYLSDPGEAYRRVAVQHALDMNVMVKFDEDYAAGYAPPPAPDARLGYGQEEVAMNWRLPPPGHSGFGVREFATRLKRDERDNPDNLTHYASPNTDLAGWVAEKISAKDLKRHLVENIEAAGIAGTFHVSLDCEFVPVLSGGGAMTARDMARYGLLFARKGAGINGEIAGSARFIDASRNGRGTIFDSDSGIRYSNHLFTNGRWVGHGGYAGQFLMADPDSETAISFFSVLENSHGDTTEYFPHVISMCEDILDLVEHG